LDLLTKLAVHTLGCKVNQYEGEGIADLAERAGVEKVSGAAEAGVIVLNTCAVTRAADLEAGQLARRFRRENPDAIIVLTGCYAQIRPEEAARLPVDYVFGHGGKDLLARQIGELEARGRRKVAEIRVGNVLRDRRLPVFSPSGRPDPARTRRLVKVQDGCDVFCSFCVVPRARGLPRSAPAEEVLGEIRRHLASGAVEIVLTGPHIGSWGKDLAPPGDLAALLARIRTEAGVSRLRLSSMEPSEFTGEVIREITEHPEVYCDHLHIPLQSGSDRILRRMRRPYRTVAFRTLAARFAEALPEIGLGTDLIAGFPGETEEDFRETVRLLEETPISLFHVFPFSPRPGTPAARHPDQNPPEVIRERAALLRALGGRKRETFHRRFLGKALEVLLETAVGEGAYRGTSRNYVPVVVRGEGLTTNKVAWARIEEIDAGGRVLGRCVA
jgi:threonylcarbamoyladenosine tRNA methylthiotransferase MtaB